MNEKYVKDIRAFNRFYTNVIGLLDQYILDSKYSLPEVRVLYELYHSEGLTASDIISRLKIDKGYLSRLILQFQKKKLVMKKISATDGRSAHLHLTTAGKLEFEQLNRSSHAQVKGILADLSETQCKALTTHMNAIRKILSDKTI
jgi:DNA-binding MarR family transcriptional regulator